MTKPNDTSPAHGQENSNEPGKRGPQTAAPPAAQFAEDILGGMRGRIAIVGNATPSHNFGGIIDGYDTVIRLNNFRVAGFEKLVGSKTDYRCTSAWKDIEHRPGLIEFSPFSANAAESANLQAFNQAGERPVLPARLDVHALIPETPKPSTGFALIQLCASLNMKVDLFAFDGFKSAHYWDQNENVYTTHSRSELDYILKRPGVLLYGETYPYQALYDFCHAHHRDYDVNVGLELVRQLKKEFHGLKALEFGAGNGHLARHLEQQGNQVTAVEASRHAFERIPCARKIHGTVLSLPFLQETFDLFVSVDVLEHLTENDCKLVIREAARLCRRLFVSVSTRPSGLLGPNGENLHLTVRPASWWENLFGEFFDIQTSPGYGVGQLVIEGGRKAPGAKPAHIASDHESEYYVNLFLKNPDWSTPHPNADEAARWAKISPLLEAIAAQQAAGKPCRILDVGCGRGWLTNLASRFGVSEGVEPVAAVAARAGKLFPKIKFTAGTADTIFASPDFQPYDVVLNSEVIEHVPRGEQPAFVQKLSRLLRPGGHVILTTPRGEALQEWTRLVGDPSQPMENWLGEPELQQLFVGEHFAVAGLERVLFETKARRFLTEKEPAGTENLLAVYQVWAFQFRPATVSSPAPKIISLSTADPFYANTPASSSRPSWGYSPAEIAAAPVVSIVTPFFNAGAIFLETVASVFRQSLQQWEWIIVNDGSTSADSLKILDEFRRKDPRIRVVDHKKNQGLSAARNTGFRVARAEFIFQLDADDLIEPTALEKMAWHLQTHPEFAFTTGHTVGFGSKEYRWENGFHCGRRFLEENMVTATCLVRKSVHQAVGGYEAENHGGAEDWDFWLKCAAHGHWGSTIPEFFDWYRRRETGREHWDNVVESDKTDKFRARLKQRYPALWADKFPQPITTRPTLLSSAAAEFPFANPLRKKNPRLLFIVPHFELGGADKFNLDLIRQLQRERGYEITVAATRRSKNPWQQEFESLTPDVFVLNNFLHGSDFPLFLRYLISSRQPDAVCLSQSLLAYQLLPYLRAHFPQLPFVDYVHMEQEEWMAGGYPRYSLHQRTQLTRTAASSRHLKNWMAARGGDPQAIEVCTTNIDGEKWRRDRFDAAALAVKWKIATTKPVLLYAGRVCEQKQPRVFAEVIKQVAKKNPSFTALVAGDGPDLPWLKEFAERERLPQIRFLGAVSNDAMAELLALTDIFFLPSQWEGISLAIYEAMAMSAVPVGAAVGGQAELVTPDCGVLVRRGLNETADYTKALLKLLAAPAERNRLAQAARRRVLEHFPIAELGRRMDAIFQEAKTAAVDKRGENLLPLELAALHATDVMEQTRATDYADLMHREREELIPFMTHSLLWQACFRAGRALAESAQTKPALEQFAEGLRCATASCVPKIELSARLEIGKALIPLDAERARQALSPALELADRLGNPAMRTQVSQALESLNTPPSAKAGPRGPLVSVVIPCYKQAHFLPEAVESVVAQTFSDWEIIIVNDGSPDNTREVARELIAKYRGKRIRLVEKINGGLSAARNTGIREGRGAYLLPLDADDKIKPTLLAKLTAILDRQPKVGFAYTHIQHFGELDTEFPLPDFDRATLIGKDNIACVCSLIRRTAWEQAGGYNEAMREGYEDWDFWVGCVEQGWEGYCLHEPLFLYRKSGATMLSSANQKRERLIAQIIQNHAKLYDPATQQWAGNVLTSHAAAKAAAVAVPAASSPAVQALNTQPVRPRLRITYLISSILGVTGGNQTLLRQAEEMRRRGHDVTLVTYSPKPDWFQFETRVVQVPAGQPMAPSVPPSDVVVATYFVNAMELRAVQAPVKVYYAQGDQFVFEDATMADTAQNKKLRELSRASYLLPGLRFVPNSQNLADAVQKLCGRQPDAILPVCTDQTIFRPLQRSLAGSRCRILIVGPDSRGTAAEPLLFKGMQDIYEALQILGPKYPHFTPVRMSSTAPDIFARVPCEFYIAPGDEMKTVLFGTAHIHIYASHYDSCPRPPQEAMAAGCAVVCTGTSGAKEYCRDGENSLLVPVKSPAAIAGAVERLIHDHALREKLAQGGLATARQFPREREWNEWEAILYRFMDEAAKPAGVAAISPKPSSAPKPAKAAAAIKLPPCALIGHLGEARDLVKKKKYQAAWEGTLAAIEARPFHPEGWLLLAEIAGAVGDGASAILCAKRARLLAPEWKPVKTFLSRSLRGVTKPAWLVLPSAITDVLAQAAPRLSVCLIVKNEEQFLAQCLASVCVVASQIIVVDTGSTDRTVEIAREHGAEIYHFPWNDDFAAARNAALEHATGDWVLALDADEELMPDQAETIAREMQSSGVMAFRLPIVDKGREQEGCSHVPRLFRNAPGLFFLGRIHEQAFSSIEVRCQEWNLRHLLGKTTLLHHGYVKEVVESRDKIARNLRLLRRAIEELPGEPNLLMNLGLELIRSGEGATGLAHYWEAVERLGDKPDAQITPELRETLLSQLTTHLIADKDFAGVAKLYQTPLAARGELTASHHFGLGLALMELKQPAAAAEQMRQCLATRGQPALSPVNKEILRGGPQHCLALCCGALQQPEAAAAAFAAALADEPASRRIRLDFARFQAGRGQALDALRALNDLAAACPQDAPVWQLGGQIALSRAEFLEFARDWTGEAFKHFPTHPALVLQRAEALLLTQNIGAALPLWREAHSPNAPRQVAALVLCELLSGDCRREFAETEERLVSQELVKWYRQLIAVGANSVVHQLHEQMDAVRAILPGFARVWEAATQKAREAVAA